MNPVNENRRARRPWSILAAGPTHGCESIGFDDVPCSFMAKTSTAARFFPLSSTGKRITRRH
jgi:hypothetical protein